jgi:Uma2 family endonuclease
MATVATTKRYTPDELLRMPEGDRYELVDGHLVERNMSTWSSYVAGKIYGQLDPYCSARKLAWVFPEGTGYQCFPDAPEKVRKPDVSAVRRDRMPEQEVRAGGYIRVFPDVAVEVVSPNDLVDETDEKVQEFLKAGSSLVWVVHTQGRYVHVFRARGHSTVVEENEELDGEDVLPGFKCRVADFFML